MAVGPRARVLLVAFVVFAALALLIWYLSTAYWSQPASPIPQPVGAEPLATPSPEQPALAPTLLPTSSLTPTPTPAAQSSPVATPNTPAPVVSSSGLVIPVAGVRPEQLLDTFSEARSEGRSHDAIDIAAPRGTPVLAAADGRIVKLFTNDKGGITIYQIGTDEHTVYYYAHLDRYADGLAEGNAARRGETIAYVGDTGNATPGNYHLHFQVYKIADPKHFWTGENVNPYTLLRDSK